MSESREPSENTDVCIVGAGVAGGIVANYLSERGHDVVVLEAGPRIRELNHEDRLDRMEKSIRPDRGGTWEEGRDSQYTDSSPSNIDATLLRLKAVGGTTLHWSAGCYRLHEKDFNMNSRYGLATDWPMNYEDLQPYYAEAESELGVAGEGDNQHIPREEALPMDGHPPTHTDKLLKKACDSLGITTHNLPIAINTEVYDGRSQCLGYSTCRACPSGAKYTGDTHIQKAENKGARVIDQAPAQRLEHDSDGESIDAVVYATPDGSRYRQEADQFVIACGGVETPRLLLLSESEQYPEGLANSSGKVGKHFFASPPISVSGELDELTNPQSVRYVTTTSEEFYDHEDPLPGSFKLNFVNNNHQSIAETALQGGTEDTIDQAMSSVTGIKWGDELLEEIPDPREKGSVGIGAHVEMLPLEQNSITLNKNKTDKYGNPVPHVSFDVGSHYTETAKYAIGKMREILSETGADISSVNGLDDLFLGSHHKGTTRMGSNPQESVVNPELRTHDLENLWISSSSVFPTGGAVSPTLTIVALSIKAAEHIDERL